MFAQPGLAPPRSGNARRPSPSPLSRRINSASLSPLSTSFIFLLHHSVCPFLSAASDLNTPLASWDDRFTGESCDSSLALLLAFLLKTSLPLDDAHSPLCDYGHSRVSSLLAFERSHSFSYLISCSVSSPRSRVTFPASIQHVACPSASKLTCRAYRRSSYSLSER